MKKNITINLCGRLFQIDEDAYELLQHYIESLRHSFGKSEGGDEIVDDIEARIAELFTELREQGNEAITIDHVKAIISRIGEPEQLTENEESDKSDKAHKFDSFNSAAQGVYDNVRKRTSGKKLFRNPNDKMVAGVLSGLAKYTDTDPVIWRLLTVLFSAFYGVGIIIYIVLAIILPEARTPEQLLQMEGKAVTPQHLADIVVDKDQSTTQQPNLFRSLFAIILKILFGFFVGIASIIAIILFCGFLFALVVLISALTFPVNSYMPFSLQAMGLAELYETNPMILIIFVFSLFMMLLIPIYAIVHMLLSLSKKVQPMGIAQRIAWILLWIVALCSIIPCSISMAKFRHEQRTKEYFHTHVYQDVLMDDNDMDFLRHGEWNLIKAEDCTHYTAHGEYFDGNKSVRYLDTYNDECRAIYQVERKQAVEPGIYRLDCIARAEGPGSFVYAIGDSKMLTTIPAYGNRGGELAAQIKKELSHMLASDSLNDVGIDESTKEVDIKGMKFVLTDLHQDNKKKLKRICKGYGWSIVSIENIVVTGDSITYGVSTDEGFTGHPYRAKWFSATDFKLTRTGDLPHIKNDKTRHPRIKRNKRR